MSQNDFIIDDGTGEAVLNDINSALQALASNSRGSIAPHILGQSYPSQFFADTANNKLFIRDGSTTTYHSLANLDGGIFVNDPSTFNDDVIFKGTDSSGSFDITFDADNTSGRGSLIFKDEVKILLGTGNDFAFVHQIGVNNFAAVTDTQTVITTRTPSSGTPCYTLQTQDSSGTDVAYEAFVNGHQELHFNGSEKFRTTANGITVTGSVTTQDIDMSNLTSKPNEVDNTQGSWSIQEGSDDLFLINRVNGKKYKFNLTEIT